MNDFALASSLAALEEDEEDELEEVVVEVGAAVAAVLLPLLSDSSAHSVAAEVRLGKAAESDD